MEEEEEEKEVEGVDRLRAVERRGREVGGRRDLVTSREKERRLHLDTLPCQSVLVQAGPTKL